MEAITHILAGVILQIVSFKFLVMPWNYLFTIILGLLSHFLIDAVAKITYHTTEPMKDDTFWIVWHIFIILISIIFTIIFINPYWIGILSANFVDIWDWLIIRLIYKKYIVKNGNESNISIKFIHNYIEILRNKLFYWLPNLNYKKKGVIIELFVISSFMLLIIILK